MTLPKLSYDSEVRAVYVQFSDNDIAETIELSRTVYVDVDVNGEPVGFEILNADPALFARLAPSTANLAWRDLLNPDAA